MAKCRYCENSGLALRIDKRGLCKGCSAEIRGDVERRLAQIKEALVYIRCSKDPEVQESFCAAALDTAARLVAYERRRLAEITPSPTALVAMLEGKREEAAAARPARAELVRAVDGGRALLSGIQAPAADAAGGDGRDWWAWEVPAERPAARPQAPRAAQRLPVDCLALLDPGAVRGSLQNISPTGLFLCTDKLHQPGRAVDLIISTALGPAKAQGVVRWVQADTLSGREPGMGIEFTEVTEELQTYLSARLGCTV